MSSTQVKGEVVCGTGVIAGKARWITHPQAQEFEDGDILLCEMTGPDWMETMQRASAIVTISGGRLCHAAIVARQMNKPCVVGARGLSSGMNKKDVLIDLSDGTITMVDGDTKEELNSSTWEAAKEAGRKVEVYDARGLWGRFTEDI